MSAASDKPTVLAAPEAAAGFRHWMAHNAWRFVLLFAGVLLPLAGFVALADEVHELESFYFDAPLLWKLHGLHSPGLDQFFVLLSKLGYECCCGSGAGVKPVSWRSASSDRPC